MEHTDKSFQENVNGWIKNLDSRISTIETQFRISKETIDNVQFNYELIKELKSKIEKLEQENKLLKLMQIVIAKRR